MEGGGNENDDGDMGEVGEFRSMELLDKEC
jgi:hypothetical protein